MLIANNVSEKSDKSVYVFIDSSNLWQAQKSKGKMLDYQKLKDFLKERFSTIFVEVFYYTAYPEEGTREYSTAPKHAFFTYLKKGLGFNVRKKPLKRIPVHSDQSGDSVKEKGNMDVEITIDAVHFFKNYGIAVFFSGDSDFLSLVSYIRNRGKKVFIFSSKNNISEELKNGGDGYQDILSIKADIWGRDLRHRNQNP